MDDNEYFARIVCEQLGSGLPVVLVSIVSFQGSSPRHNGTKMVVGADGKSYGTIGGGLLEATAIKEARTVQECAHPKFMYFDLTGNSAYARGMICGGKAVLLVDYIAATKENMEFCQCWLDAILSGNDFYFITHLKGKDDAVNVMGHSILNSNGELAGNYPLAKSDHETLSSELYNISTTSIVTLADTRIIVEPVRKLKTVYCFGAGHVALPTAHIAALVGFRVVVIDDRNEFANAERFPDAFKVNVIGDFAHALEGLQIDADSFIIILTRGHQYDRIVLEQSLKTKAGYIGMISSRKKREAIYEALITAGVKKEELARVHSPIGIAIGGETPEEIAVSIVAELISERARQQA